MRKLIASALITLDGLAGGSNNELDWFMPDEEFEAELRHLHSTVDTILLGRRTYEVFVQFWPTANDAEAWGAAHMNRSPKIVFSTTLKDVPWGTWNNARVVGDHVAEEITRLKQQPGKDMVIYASPTLVQSLTNLGLIDEYQLLVHPIILGSGKSLFAGVDHRVKLKLTRSTALKSGVMILYYEPAKQ